MTHLATIPGTGSTGIDLHAIGHEGRPLLAIETHGTLSARDAVFDRPAVEALLQRLQAWLDLTA